MERAIERIAAGHPPPRIAIGQPNPEAGAIRPHVPTQYRIPGGFPNPPPEAPLNGTAGLRLVLAQCGLTDAQTTSLMGNNITCLEDFGELGEEEVEEHLKILARTSEERGGMVLGLGVVPRVKALSTLLHELARSGDGVLDAYKVTIPYLREWQSKSKVVVKGNDKLEVSMPEKFDYKDWVSFKDGIENYFRQTKGTRMIPLYYIIRSETPPTGIMSFAEARLWNARHDGPEYEDDNARVYQQLVQVFRGTDGWAYVAMAKPQDGRAAWKRLCHHYDGPHAVEKRIAWAKSEITNTVYASEARFPLERYVTKLTDCFRILEQNGAAKSEREKVDAFYAGLKSTNEDFKSLVTLIFNNIEVRNNYQATADALLESSYRMASITQRESTSARKVAKANAKRDGKSGNGNSNKKKAKSNDGQSGPPTGTYVLDEKNGKKLCNGIDVTNPKRNFTNEEWGKMGDYVSILKAERKIAAANTNNSSGNGSRFGTGGQGS